MPRKEAIKFCKDAKEPYKVELIEDLPVDEVISFYKQGEFTDLCAGPHLMSTGKVKVVKLLSVSGAYWKGDEHNKMLQRVYAISFPKKSLLDEYLAMLEDAKVSVRNARRDGMDDVKKAEFSEDVEKQMEDDIQELVNKYNKQAEDMTKEKENDLMSV